MENDADWFENGLKEALEGLYWRALKITRNVDDAEDLLQKVALKALRKRDKFRKGSALGPWLGIMMKNTYIDEHRRANNAKFRVIYCELEPDLHPDKRKLEDGMSDATMAGLRAAGPEFAEAITLVAEGKTRAEIREMLGIGESSLNHRLARGRAKFKQAYDEYKRKKA